MFTECPRCHALFRISQADLEAAEGWVRCGECGHVFEARVSEREESEDSEAPSTETPDQAPVSLDEDLIIAEDDLPFTTEEHADSIPKSRPRGLWRPLLFTTGALLLIALAGFLYAYGQKIPFTHSPLIRPVLLEICRFAGCTLAPRHDLKAIVISRRAIATSTLVPHALSVTATIVNKAPFPQPYPRMRIRFFNLAGQEIARGTFTPAQYLPANINPNALMPVNKPIDVHFTINDPGQKVMGYEFTFLP